mmetsp:Transcript_15917/g.34854  ORF Transcript_15917/g.34854 Transcript_15917/m.34854 type:complete len:219 (-) Transcript_15917:781-1437(-)
MAQSSAATWHDALVDRSLGGIDRILKPQLFVLKLGLCGGAHLDERHAADKLRQAFLQLILGVLALGLLDLGPNLRTSLLEQILGCIGNNGGRVLFHRDAACAAEILSLDAIQLAADLLGQISRPRHQRNVLQDGLPVVAKARCLDGAAVHDASQLVDDECRKNLLLNAISDDEKRLGYLLCLGQDGDQLCLRHGDLLVGNENQRIGGLPLPGIHVGRV